MDGPSLIKVPVAQICAPWVKKQRISSWRGMGSIKLIGKELGSGMESESGRSWGWSGEPMGSKPVLCIYMKFFTELIINENITY